MIYKGKTCKVGSEADEEGKAPNKGKPWLWTLHAAQEPASTASSRAVSGCELPLGQGGLPLWRAICQKGGSWAWLRRPSKGEMGGVWMCAGRCTDSPELGCWVALDLSGEVMWTSSVGAGLEVRGVK